MFVCVKRTSILLGEIIFIPTGNGLYCGIHLAVRLKINTFRTIKPKKILKESKEFDSKNVFGHLDTS